ncbi:MAG TPA: hypothetical protein VFA83_06915 [Acidimicrobiales bacterium]|nr:hypothetical protein [Acidimicrobiales bacterium]
MSRLAGVVATVLCSALVAGCGHSSAKPTAVSVHSEVSATVEAETSTTAAASGSASGGARGTATVSPGTHSTTTARSSGTGTTTTVAAAPTTSTTRSVPAGSTGVRGVVTAGPTCPVQREGDPSCDDKPVPAHLVLQRGDGSTAASGDAGGDGQFFIAAGAGSYTLTATSPNAMRCASQPVSVTSGHVTDVHVSCDTGIR